MNDSRIVIEVVCVTAGAAHSHALSLPAGARVEDALVALKLLPLPSGTRSTMWGRPVDPGETLLAGARLEVCAPLLNDPRSRRRKRALNFSAGGGS